MREFLSMRWANAPARFVAVVVALAVALPLGVYALTVERPFIDLGDSYFVSRGAANAVECLELGIHSSCDAHNPDPRWAPLAVLGVGPYPPPQYGVAVVAQQVFGVSIRGTLG